MKAKGGGAPRHGSREARRVRADGVLCGQPHRRQGSEIVKDEIRSSTAGVLAIIQKEVTTRVEGETLVIHVEVTAQADPEEIVRAVTAERQKNKATPDSFQFPPVQRISVLTVIQEG
jgi:hypothetical protein